MRKILCLCLLLGTQFAFGADVFRHSNPRPFTLADQLELDATVGGYPVWQGERDWRMFAITKHDSTGMAIPVALGQLSVFQTENKKLVSVMQVTGNLSQSNMNDWSDEPCKREDFLFKASLGGKLKNVNCVTLNHLTGYLNNPSGSWVSLYSLLNAQEVDPPPTVLQFAFTRYTNSGRRLVVTVTINPELAGFARDTETWGRSSWHKSQAFSNPEKRRFIDALGVWGVQFAKRMDRAFDKKQDAFLDIPSWRSVFDAKPGVDLVKSGVAPVPMPSPVKATSPVNDKTLSVEDRLKELKRLFDAGLITSDVYADRQKAILN